MKNIYPDDASTKKKSTQTCLKIFLKNLETAQIKAVLKLLIKAVTLNQGIYRSGS